MAKKTNGGPPNGKPPIGKRPRAAAGHQGLKLSIYIPEADAAELRAKSEMLGVSISKLLCDAWKLAQHYDGPPIPGVLLGRDKA